MSGQTNTWAQRERDTNRLVRLMAGYLLENNQLSPRQMLGLCRLTWITRNFDQENASYVISTKIPALLDVFELEESKTSLERLANYAESKIGTGAKDVILKPTGFTNLRGPYRNSIGEWLRKNHEKLWPMFLKAFYLPDDAAGLGLIKEIAQLDRIPVRSFTSLQMDSIGLLSPVFFALDHRLRFPLINGNSGVKRILKTLGVDKASLPDKYQAMVSQYGKDGITDAADLDQVGQDENHPWFSLKKKPLPVNNILKKKRTNGNTLPVKDESDVKVIRKSMTTKSRRLHNELTNRLLRFWGNSYTLTEGNSEEGLYDVAVINYDHTNNDLFVEVKSSCEAANLRMAIGQLFSYWFAVKEGIDHHLAICLPEKPEQHICELLKWLNIGLLWFDDKGLRTETAKLEHLQRNYI